MAIVAPMSKYKKQNLWILIAVFVGCAAVFAFDGYIRKGFIEKHTVTNEAGEEVPDSTLAFNRNSPPYFLAGALLITVYYFIVRGKKVVAGDTSLQMGKVEIPYDSIESINKTFFDKKGYFTITYKDGDKETDLKLSDRSYDNMQAVLDELIKQIS